MSTPLPPAPAQLFIGIIVRKKQIVADLATALNDTFGPMDLVSPWMAFDFTEYYYQEMGAPLYRRIFAFESLIEQTDIVDVKIATNGMEQQWSQNGRRSVNLDPGYLLAERMVLATGKNFAHRIYLNKGIYADLTLVYRRGRFQHLPWTYPGYRQETVQLFLLQLRSKYMHKLKHMNTKKAEKKANDSEHDSLCPC